MFPKYFTQTCLIFLTLFFRDHKLLIFINLIFSCKSWLFCVFYLRNLCLTKCPIQKNWHQALKRYYYSSLLQDTSRCVSLLSVELEAPGFSLGTQGWPARSSVLRSLTQDGAFLVPHSLVLVTYVPSLPWSLSASLIWFLNLPILPQSPTLSPPTQPLSQNPSFHPFRIQVPWGEGWGSEVTA